MASPLSIQFAYYKPQDDHLGSSTIVPFLILFLKESLNITWSKVHCQTVLSSDLDQPYYKCSCLVIIGGMHRCSCNVSDCDRNPIGSSNLFFLKVVSTHIFNLSRGIKAILSFDPLKYISVGVPFTLNMILSKFTLSLTCLTGEQQRLLF